MPPFTGYGAYSGVAGALDGLGQFLRGRKEDQLRERQEARQAELDKQAQLQQRIAMALTRGQMAAAGIREGEAPGAGFAVPGLTDGSMVQVQDPTRYTTLGDGFYMDRNATPAFQKEQKERLAGVSAANAEEAQRIAIGQALQSDNPREALSQLLKAGVSATDAAKMIETASPAQKVPVPGTEAYYAMKEREAQIGAKYRGGAGGAGGGGGSGAPMGPNGQPPIDTNELMKWRGEFAKMTGTERGIAEGYSKLRAASAKGVQTMTAADDMAMIYGFMKMQDPGSTVREGEYATAEQATGVDGRVLQLYNKAKDGTKLTPEMRAEFLATAQRSAKEADNRVRRVATDMIPLMTRRGVDPSEVVTAPFSGMLTQNAGPSANAPTLPPIAGADTALKQELSLAQQALQQGVSYDTVARKFKQRTGRDLPR